MPDRRNRSDDTAKGRRNFLKASGAGAVALSLAGCSGGDTNQDPTTGDESTSGDETTDESVNTVEEGNAERGGTFTYGLPEKPDTPNILMSSSVYGSLPLSRIYETGATIEPVNFEVKPWVFTDWKVENAGSADSKPDVYFNVREGLKWNDGEDFTKEDVMFTYQYLIDNVPGQYASMIDPIESISEASNDWDFHLKLKQPVSTFELDQLGLPLLPKHKWEGKDYKKYDPTKNGGPVGLGPGRLTKYQPDTAIQITFDHQNYYDTLSQLQWRKDHKQILAGGPFVEKLNFKVYGSSTAMTQAFMQGEIDTHYGSMKTAKIPDVEKAEDKGLVKGYDSGFSYFGFNHRRQPLDDVALRQAMSFMFDDYYWVEQLMGGYVIEGDYAQSPGYSGVRPESVFDGELSTDPATEAFAYRGNDNGTPKIETIRKFLTDGKVIDGSQGTYAGKEFPGTLSGVKASQSEAKYDYSFGPVKTSFLKNKKHADKELRIDGKTIPEIMDGDPLVMFIDPPKDTPKEAKAIKRWTKHLQTLGIPVKTEAVDFNTMVAKVFVEEDFDMWPMGWGGTGPFGSSLYAFFHSSQADDLSDGNEDSQLYNATGYGLHGGSADELLSTARTTMDPTKRNEATAKAIEKIYLDCPYMLMDYSKQRWPVNTEKFTGFVNNIVDPAYAYFGTEINNIHLKN